jgi:hypothetical protein
MRASGVKLAPTAVDQFIMPTARLHKTFLSTYNEVERFAGLEVGAFLLVLCQGRRA